MGTSERWKSSELTSREIPRPTRASFEQVEIMVAVLCFGLMIKFAFEMLESRMRMKEGKSKAQPLLWAFRTASAHCRRPPACLCERLIRSGRGMRAHQ